MAKFEKGHIKNGGRKIGTPNKLTTSVKSAVLATFQELQSDPKHNLTAFAMKYPRDFYQIASKLIPHELSFERMSDENLDYIIDSLKQGSNG